jgi:uncharacterized protein (DUF427 family)
MSMRRGLVRTEPCAKRIRAYLGGVLVVDTLAALLVWEMPYHPTYYLPVGDIRAELRPDGAVKRSLSRGEGSLFTVRTGTHAAPGAALRYPESPFEELRGLVRLDWDAMDSWFEEDEEVFFHPRDPHTRVDVLPSSRTVRVEIDGTVVAESSAPRILFETGLPVRYYLPKPHVRMDLLEPSDTVSVCPYKGTAGYWSVRDGDTLHPDVAWGYPTPLPESRQVAGLVCFYNEKVDTYLDGVLEQRPTIYTRRLQGYRADKQERESD